MNKMITIDYEEYLELEKYKAMVTRANASRYELETRGDSLDPMRSYEVYQDTYNKELFDYLKKGNEVICIRIWRGSDD